MIPGLHTFFTFLSALCFFRLGAHALMCVPGRYVTEEGCKSCPYATYKSSFSNDTSCTPCPNGLYTPVWGVISSKLCLPCPFDSKPSPNGSKCVRCGDGFVGACGKCIRCPPGTFVNRDTCSCQKCNDISISTEWNQPSCNPCPADHIGDDARVNCIQPKCDPGSEFSVFSNEDHHCQECAFNTYRSDIEMMDRCERCPYGTIGETIYSSNVKCLKCEAGQYATRYAPQTQIGRFYPVCKECPVGSETRAAGNGLCRKIGSKCPVNSVEDGNGDCKSCDYNHRMDFATGICVPCPEGHVAPQGVAKSCTKCPENSIVLRDDECQCIPGYLFRNGVCTPCEKGTIIARSTINQITCTPCPAGSIASRVGMSECEMCPEGTRTVGRDRTTCVPTPKCDPGYKFLDNIYVDLADPECVSVRTGCAAGLKPVARKGSFVCVDSAGNVKCPPNSVYNNAGKCIACSTGHYVGNSSGSSKLQCKRCKLHKIALSAVATECVPCPKGFKADTVLSTRTECYCNPGRFIRQRDGVCARCPPSSVSPTRNNTKCQKCENGFEPDLQSRYCICPQPKIVDRNGVCVSDEDAVEYV